MLPQRTPLGVISRNKIDGKYLSLYQRGLVVGEARAGAKQADIARDLFLLPTTVRYTIYQQYLCNNSTSLPRKPRKKSYTDSNERVLLRYVRLNLKDIYKQVIEAYSLDCKERTIKRILARYSIAN